MADDTDPTGSVVRVTGSVATEEAWRDAIHSAVPSGLKTFLTWPDRQPQGPVVILVHGSLDRGPSFTRAIHRLDGSAVVTYDRRGYQGSREVGPAASLDVHVEDLAALAHAADLGQGVVAVGHSFGGVIVQGTALADSDVLAAIGAYEPPMSYLLGQQRPAHPPLGDPGEEVERFFSQMMGAAAWERLSEGLKQDRRADGPGLLSDLAIIRAVELDPTKLTVPVVYGCGGERSAERHRLLTAWLADHVKGAELVTIADAGHGAHLSHPDAFADLVLRTATRGAR